MYVRAGIKVFNGERTFGDVALADTGATGIIIDEPVAEELKLMGFSEKIILGVSAIEDAGYVPNTEKGVLEKVGLFAL